LKSTPIRAPGRRIGHRRPHGLARLHRRKQGTYSLRREAVEPVFGIIKEALGFRRFHLRGLCKVNLEWTLVRLAYNVKRLYHIAAARRSPAAC